jgi:hypothetical protein
VPTLERHAPWVTAVALSAAALGVAGSAATHAPLAAFAAQSAGQPLLFGLRAGLVAGASWVCVERRAWRTLACVAVAFVASLATRALLFGLIAAALFAFLDARRWGGVALLAACLAPWSLRGPARHEASPPVDPAARVAYYRARDNAWRARHAALEWARAEHGAPGRGFLALAQIDWALGQRRESVRALRLLSARAADPALRARAGELERRWHLAGSGDAR